TGQRILMRRPCFPVHSLVLHVHVKQDCAPGKRTFLSEKDKVQYRAKGLMPFRATSTTEKIGA
ncbi:hypothetical protein, partial [Bacteroides sp. HPS0048]|uniref:hypothetical protein n=1 Tax=Bacteroides sp. HPS0048 TaxID=1078089 RepID=UPI00356AAE65